jgi:hypothetical protein
MKSERQSPKLSKEAAVMLADASIGLPQSPLTLIDQEEVDAYIQLTLFRGMWNCSLTFAWASYGATGHHEQLGQAVRRAILRAYDAGEEEGWQQRHKAFKGEHEQG